MYVYACGIYAYTYFYIYHNEYSFINALIMKLIVCMID